MNILLLEDDRDLCNALSYQLENEGHRVDCCCHGSDAELYIRQDIYDLILLDCMLPGADDYLVKPFAFSELCARIGSLFRRKEAFHMERPSFGDLALDISENRLFCKEKCCMLSQTESNLMHLLLQADGKILSRSVLLHKVWGLDTSVDDSNLDNYIYFLRKRLKTLESQVRINNRRRLGYHLEMQETD